MIQHCSNFPRLSFLTYGYVYHDTSGQNHGTSLKNQWFFGKGISTDTPLQDCYGRDSSKKHLVDNWRKHQPGNFCFVHRQQGPCLSVYVDDIKMASKEDNLEPTWKRLMKHVDLEKPTSFLDHVYLGCTQRECKAKQNLVEENRKCSTRESLQERLKSYLAPRNVVQTRLRGPTLWKDLRRIAWNGTVNWQTQASISCIRSHTLS